MNLLQVFRQPVGASRRWSKQAVSTVRPRLCIVDRNFPKQETFLGMIRQAGFEQTKYRNLSTNSPVSVKAQHFAKRTFRTEHPVDFRVVGAASQLGNVGRGHAQLFGNHRRIRVGLDQLHR